MSFFDYFRRLLGWPSSTPSSATANWRTIQVRWTEPSYSLTWAEPTLPLEWTEPVWPLIWTDDDEAR